MKPLPPKTFPRAELARTFMLVGLLTLTLSALLASLGREPFATWFFSFAWWSYILIVDGWVYRHRGESLLISYPGRFLFLALWSVGFWFLFEAFNIRLQNWHYHGLPTSLPLRWVGYFLAFGTVVPALLETADLVDTADVSKTTGVTPLRASGRAVSVILGMLMLLAPLLWPQQFYPLIWGALIFLLEPLNEKLGGESLLKDWRSGGARRFSLLLAAGILCGILWESLNMIGTAHWTYSIPGDSGWKLFEMPLLGYLGFLPFAVSVYTASVTAVTLWEKSKLPVRTVLATAWLAFSLAMCAGVDRFTLKP